MEKIDLLEKLEEAERHFTPGIEIPQEEIEKGIQGVAQIV
jgi:hypothetical protein